MLGMKRNADLKGRNYTRYGCDDAGVSECRSHECANKVDVVSTPDGNGREMEELER